MIEDLIYILHPCADCPIRCKGIEKPHSVFARLHRWHSRWWPGWRKYQADLRVNKRNAIAAAAAND